MNSHTQFDRHLLLSGDLLKAEFFKLPLAELNGVSEPVGYLIAGDYVIRENFFEKLAKLYDLDYLNNIDVVLDSKNAIAWRIPASILIRHTLFVQLEETELQIISYTPFIAAEAIEKILVFCNVDSYVLRIASPNVIRAALTASFYKDASLVSENLVHVLYEHESSRGYMNAIVPRIFPILTTIAFFVWVLLDWTRALTIVFVILNCLCYRRSL